MAETERIRILVNGEPNEVPAGLTVLDLLRRLGVDAERVALELDREILKRDHWGDTRLQDGSAVEIVQFVGGG